MTGRTHEIIEICPYHGENEWNDDRFVMVNFHLQQTQQKWQDGRNEHDINAKCRFAARGIAEGCKARNLAVIKDLAYEITEQLCESASTPQEGDVMFTVSMDRFWASDPQSI